MARVFVGVGSNLEPARNVRAALLALAREARVTAVSTFYRTPPLTPDGGPGYYNGVVEIETALSPSALKPALSRIERAHGRVRSVDKWAPRTIDLDLLLVTRRGRVDAGTLPPSPELRTRRFVARAIAELAPALVLPDGTRLRDLPAAAPPWPMEPLREFTDRLRRELLASAVR